MMQGPSKRHHIVSAYDRDLDHLLALVAEMGDHAVEQTQRAVQALLEGDATVAHQVIDREPEVDTLNLAADEEVFSIIARRQPAAVDLRLVLAVSKVVGELERAGDKAARIARSTLRLLESPVQILAEPLPRLLRENDAIACCMLDRAVEAMAGADLAKAVGVLDDDDRLHAASLALSQALLAANGPARGEPLAAMLTIAHALDRIGNHAANIAEQAIYVIRGEDVRYRNRALLIDALRAEQGAQT
jgi:phosphate transport system protein